MAEETKDIPIGSKPEEEKRPVSLEEATSTPAENKPMLKVEGSSDKDILDAVLKAKEEDILPWEDCVLPSQGVYYLDADGNQRIPGGVVQVRPMGIHADKILATQRLAQSGQALTYLYDNCVRFPDGTFSSEELLVGDSVFLLYYLRGITHGNEYEFMLPCPECEVSSIQMYDLNDLQSTIKFAQGGDEPFKVVLPHLSKLTGREFFVKVRLMRTRDSRAMMAGSKAQRSIAQTSAPRAHGEKRPNRKQRVVEIDQSLDQNLNMLIVEVQGSSNPMHIKNVIGKLHASDTATIREFLADVSPGIETKIDVDCQGCNKTFTTDLPITESFFRPTL